MKCICGGFSFNEKGRCNNCGSMAPPSDSPKTTSIIGNDNPNDLIEAMRRARIPKQSECIKCGKTTLSYNERKGQFTCLNLECVCFSQLILSKTSTYSEIIKFIKSNNSKSNCSNNAFETPQDEKRSKKQKGPFIGVVWPDNPKPNEQELPRQAFSNPSLLRVKMLLSENRPWRKEYHEREYVCTDFSRDVIDFMTAQEIRCGFVTITFDLGEGHAIVAFDTDYGLVYFEPQSGNQVEPKIGEKYVASSQGYSKESVITNIEILWNC